MPAGARAARSVPDVRTARRSTSRTRCSPTTTAAGTRSTRAARVGRRLPMDGGRRPLAARLLRAPEPRFGRDAARLDPPLAPRPRPSHPARPGRRRELAPAAPRLKPYRPRGAAIGAGRDAGPSPEGAAEVRGVRVAELLGDLVERERSGTAGEGAPSRAAAPRGRASTSRPCAASRRLSVRVERCSPLATSLSDRNPPFVRPTAPRTRARISCSRAELSERPLELGVRELARDGIGHRQRQSRARSRRR